jgi:hypothetical protein
MVRNFNHKTYMHVIVRNYNTTKNSDYKEVNDTDEEDRNSP